MQLRSSSSSATDRLEVMAMLPKANVIDVNGAGSFEAPAGVSIHLIDIQLGNPRVTTGRGIDITSPYTITNTPYTQDLSYYAFNNFNR